MFFIGLIVGPERNRIQTYVPVLAISNIYSFFHVSESRSGSSNPNPYRKDRFLNSDPLDSDLPDPDPPDPDPVPWSWTGSTLLAEWIRLAKTGTDKEFLFKQVSYNPDNDADPCLWYKNIFNPKYNIFCYPKR